MIGRRKSTLNKKNRYLQIALNGSLSDARQVISQIPLSERIIIEAGTPLIKRYGAEGIRQIKNMYASRVSGIQLQQLSKKPANFSEMVAMIRSAQSTQGTKPAATDIGPVQPYIVADMKMMDRGETEVEIAAHAGASAVVALGMAPVESLNAFIDACEANDVDSMIDMMNVDFPISVLRELRRPPDVVILHRGVDEERFNKEAALPLHEIRRVKGAYDMMIAVAGGDTIREVQSAIFNDADIVVVWKDFMEASSQTTKVAEEFLKRVK